jgi:hypothetical protein
MNQTVPSGALVETIAAGQTFRGVDEPRPLPNLELVALCIALGG